jgi:hypothetical protein
MTITNIVGNVLFGAIGFVAFVYGKRMEAYKTMCIGLLLMVYPYFVSDNTTLMYCIGAALTVALFVFRD